MDMHAAAMRCTVVAVAGLDEATRALQTMGSPGSSAATLLDVEMLMQSLMRHPLGHILPEVSHYCWSSTSTCTGIDSFRCLHVSDAGKMFMSFFRKV